jgi:hypothetical protein
VPGLSCEHAVYYGGRGVDQRVGCARCVKGFVEIAGKIINEQKLKEDNESRINGSEHSNERIECV